MMRVCYTSSHNTRATRQACTLLCCVPCCPGAALTVSVFRAYPQQRSSLADEVQTTVLATMHISGKAPTRLFEATGAGLEPLPVMMATALITQLVQVRAGCRLMKAQQASRQPVRRHGHNGRLVLVSVPGRDTYRFGQWRACDCLLRVDWGCW